LFPYTAKCLFTSLFREQRRRQGLASAFLLLFIVTCGFAPALPAGPDGSRHAGETAEKHPAAWHVRLSVAMPSQGLADSMNTLGISPFSSTGKDLLDIPDQPRLPWGGKYLDLVFPHPEWGGELTDYSSDFRPARFGQAKIESWHFEVRSNVLNEKVIFSWHGPEQVLAHCRLRDAESGRLLVAGPGRDGYAFIMTAPVMPLSGNTIISR
jgi:hypothetical protein